MTPEQAARLVMQALDLLETVDFSRFPGVYDKIPWQDLERIARTGK